MFIRQTIEIRPNNKQKTYFRRCFGAHRMAYNYGLSEWIRRRDAGEKTNCRDIRAQFNAEKAAGRWPFLSRLSSAATTFAFDDLKRSFENFFEGHKKIESKSKDDVSCFPKYKKKNFSGGCYTEYFGKHGGAKIVDCRITAKDIKRSNGSHYTLFKKESKPDNANPNKPYLQLSRIGTVRMMRPLRYDGRPVSVTIYQHNERFYASFMVEITEEEFYRVHPQYMRQPTAAIGIDLGIKEMAVTSDGICIENPKYWGKNLEKQNRLQLQMNHCTGKGANAKPSHNFIKAKIKLWKCHTHLRYQGEDLRKKFCAAVLALYQHISIETLGIKQMSDGIRKNKYKRKQRLHLAEVSLYEIRHRLETMGELLGRNVVAAPNNYPSSRICCKCGYVRPHMNVNIRIYRCPECGNKMDRDLNAAINLRNIIGGGTPDSMSQSADCMRSELIRSGVKHHQIGEGK